MVGTPRLDDGNVDLSQVFAAVETAAPHLQDGVVVVVKSTVPVGTTKEAAERLAELRPGLEFHPAANPEFLRQGAAVADFEKPDRIVLGVSDPAAESVLRTVFAPFIDAGVPTLVTTPESAELIKYAASAFLATKLSFINEIADLCEASGAEVEEVTRGLGLDRRIGPAFLRPGPGFGGACLPKDTRALLHTLRIRHGFKDRGSGACGERGPYPSHGREGRGGCRGATLGAPHRGIGDHLQSRHR